MEKHGFVVMEQTKLNVGVVALIQMANNCVYQLLRVHRRKHRFALAALLCIPGNLLGAPLRQLFPWPDDIYMNNTVIALKPASSGPAQPAAPCAG